MAYYPKNNWKPTKKQIGLRHGFRSGLESGTSKSLTKKKVKFKYESEKIEYHQPAVKRTYTPDFILDKKQGGKLYIETKGIFDSDMRKKHLLVRKSHPDMDLRFVFSNANAKIYKGSKTTNAMWCDRNKFRWAHRTIPEAWLKGVKREN